MTPSSKIPARGLAQPLLVGLASACLWGAGCLSVPELSEPDRNRTSATSFDDPWQDLLSRLQTGTAHESHGASMATTSASTLTSTGITTATTLATETSGVASAGELTGSAEAHTISGSGSGASELTSGTTDADESGQLRITELLSDPSGKDGGLESPEYIEIANLGPGSFELANLELRARSWPTLTGQGLGLDDWVLEPEGILVIQRFAKDEADIVVDPRIVEGALWVGFAHSSGLRNADGGILINDIRATEPLDGVIYGAVQEPPYSDAWMGAAVPTPGSGTALCRLRDRDDNDDATDFIACEVNPGQWMDDTGDDSAKDGSADTEESTATSASSTDSDDSTGSAESETSSGGEASSSGEHGAESDTDCDQG